MYKIEYHSAFHAPEVFETDSNLEANQIALAGVDQQYLVYINGVKITQVIQAKKTEILDNGDIQITSDKIQDLEYINN
tara:strand:- start:540 stop:773 length:234 start_codon:yes stop_codon:yes gene_type:complete